MTYLEIALNITEERDIYASGSDQEQQRAEEDEDRE
jgi:hypothetical protein